MYSRKLQDIFFTLFWWDEHSVSNSFAQPLFYVSQRNIVVSRTLDLFQWYHLSCRVCLNKYAHLFYMPFSWLYHYGYVIMGTIASQLTSLTIVYSTVYWDADQRKHQSSASLAFVRGIHRGPVNSPHRGPVTRKMVPFDDVIMLWFIDGLV